MFDFIYPRPSRITIVRENTGPVFARQAGHRRIES